MIKSDNYRESNQEKEQRTDTKNEVKKIKNNNLEGSIRVKSNIAIAISEKIGIIIWILDLQILFPLDIVCCELSQYLILLMHSENYPFIWLKMQYTIDR